MGRGNRGCPPRSRGYGHVLSGGEMNQLRMVLLASLLLLPASRVWADEFYAAVVCNDGRLDINVAAACRPAFLFSSDFVIRGWTKVSPGKCEEIYRGLYYKNQQKSI